ncbi:hypothetical protein [Mycoplasmopsis cynos]|uniref:hypothetical protein n=1 Tax=Mycoplasmopsis cynos TaxID=171284 RepID=UPI0021FCBB05|nr:hypothetical protein [Mycoplasmopsis cynos]UWV77765.1 hypothetical protein NW070_02565 [Mycoplasmopsis cynos]
MQYLWVSLSSSSIIGCNILDKPKSKNSEELKNEIKSLNEKSSTFTSIKNTKKKKIMFYYKINYRKWHLILELKKIMLNY